MCSRKEGGWRAGGGDDYVPQNATGKNCQIKFEVLDALNIGYLGSMSGKKLHRLGPIRGIDGLGFDPRYPLSQLTTFDCTSFLHTPFA